MLSPSALLVLAAAFICAYANPTPVHKRISQLVDESTTLWKSACGAAGGRNNCNILSVASFEGLLFAKDPCAQQDGADAMINLAKQLGAPNNTNVNATAIAQMITFAQIFVQQPRDSVRQLPPDVPVVVH